MVIVPATSRAGTLALIGGELALDFANTSSGRGSSNPKDHLQRASDVALWAAHAHVLPRTMRVACRGGGNDAALGAGLLRKALALRTDVYELGAAVAAGGPTAPNYRKPYEIAHARPGPRPADADRRQFRLGLVPAWGPVEAILGPISLSALTLLQQADLTRVSDARAMGAAGFSSTRQRTGAGAGAKWRFAAIAPSRNVSARGSAAGDGERSHVQQLRTGGFPRRQRQ